jgi:hypothetical protein
MLVNVRQINLSLQVTTIVLVSAAVLSLAAGLFVPLETQGVSASSKGPTAAINHSQQLPPVDSFAPIFSRSLQASGTVSGDAAAAQADSQANAPAAPVAQLELVGTIGDSLALIQGPDGTVAIVEPGDDVNGSPVMAIRPSEVDLRINGKVTTLRKAPAPDDSAVLQAR